MTVGEMIEKLSYFDTKTKLTIIDDLEAEHYEGEFDLVPSGNTIEIQDRGPQPLPGRRPSTYPSRRKKFLV